MKKLSLRSLFLLMTCIVVIASCEKEEKDGALPAVPDGLRAEPDSANRSVALYWNTEDGLTYELDVENTSYTAFGVPVEVPGLQYNVDYSWKVRAKKGEAYSKWSEAATFRIDQAGIIPAPTGLQHQLDEYNNAALEWSNLNVDSYEISLNSTAYTATTNRIEINDLLSNTDYTWKVRAKKNDKYSEWSATSNFRTATVPIIKRVRGNWGANDAVIRILLGTDQLNLDELLLRTHAAGTLVQVNIVAGGEQSLMTVTGMDAYITGGVASTTAFNIDGQLSSLPLTGNESTGTVSASKSVSSNNTYTKTVNIKFNEIPNYEEILGQYANTLKNATIKTVALKVTQVTITGTLDDNNQMTCRFEYEVTVAVTTDYLGGLLDSVLNSELPKPQKLLSDVVCTK